MTIKLLPMLCAALLPLPMVAGSALSQSRSGTPYADVAQGRIMNFADIKARVDRAIGGHMIGSDYDAASFTYQLRYMRNGEIVDVVVDARSGKIIGGRESM